MWHGELGWRRSVGFEHVGDAGSRVAGVGGTQLSKELLGLSGEGGIAAQVRASASGRALPRQEPNQLVGVTGFELFWQSQENMRMNFVGTQVREEGILLILLSPEGRA